LDAAFQAWPRDVVVGALVTAEEEDADLSPSLRILELARFARFGRSSQYLVCRSREQILTLLVRGLADDKVEHARDDAIKFVAGLAGAIAFN